MIWLQRGFLVLTLVFAAATIFLAMKIQEVPLPDQFELPNGFSTPILAMEFPRDAADLAFVRGLENEDMRRHIYVVQYIDQFFPWAYAGLVTVFIAFLTLKFSGRASNRWAVIGPMLPVLILLPHGITSRDFYENEMIDRAIIMVMDEDSALPRAESRVAESVTSAAWRKWGMIGVSVLMIGILFAMNGYLIMGGLLLIPALVTSYARFIDPTGPTIEFMAQTIAVFFLAIPLMAVYFLVQSFRRTEPTNESPRQVES
ncbi:hypothetical protein [Hyphobacterium sp.]|uniref:hypothetical protein n=1 Tax=Hyphobacterium sp. TaxID=2004662 RepID=UPI003BACB3A6